jgi:hypothetical protein
VTATPHDGYERSFASLIELLDSSLLDGKGKPREALYRDHVIRRLKKHVRVRNPTTGEYVHFPERKMEPVEIPMDDAPHREYVELHRSLLGFIAPALRKALRTKQYDHALAYLALLKCSTSAVYVLRNTMSSIFSPFAPLSICCMCVRLYTDASARQPRQGIGMEHKELGKGT